MTSVSPLVRSFVVEPMLSMLRNALLEEPATAEDRVALERMRGMHDLIALISTWFDDVQRMDHADPVALDENGRQSAKGA